MLARNSSISFTSVDSEENIKHKSEVDMFKGNKREVFSFRKYKNGRTDSKLIGATILALGMGIVATTTQTISADVVNGSGGNEVALVDSTDKTTSANTNTFTDDTNTTKVLKVDAVLNKGISEPTKANENKGEADGTDTVNLTSETTVNYKLEEDKSLLKTETVATGSGTITTPYDKKGISADTDGKDYRESTANKSGITVSEETGKQDTLELNGKVYGRTRSEVEGADKAKYSKTQFNDIEASVSPEGMHNKLGEIDYTKTTGKVYLVEETSEGHYGKFVETDGVSSDEDAVTKWKAGLANAKDFTKANVTLQEGDSILVLDKDTYAVGDNSSKTVETRKRYNGFTFGNAENSVNIDVGSSFTNPTYTLSGPGLIESANILEAGADGIFGTSDDVRKSVDANQLYDFADGGDWLHDALKEDLKPFFELKDYVPLDPSTNPTLSTALKKHKMYDRIYQILNFAQNEATSQEDKDKVAATKAKLDTYLEGVATKLADKGVKLAYLPETLARGGVKKGYYFTGGPADFMTSNEANDLISPSGTGVSSILNGLTFSNLKETTAQSGTVKVTTSVRKDYTLDDTGSFSVVTTTTKTATHLIDKSIISTETPEVEMLDSEFSELVKSGNVKVNDDGSVTVSTTETAPTIKFYKVASGDSDNVDDPNKELHLASDGLFHVTQEERERDNLSGFKAVATSTHNETTYNKHEIITPIRAYKVVSDGTSTVTHYYRLKKAPLNVNYYLEGTETSLAPSENQAELPVKSDYTTQSKTIEPKTEVQDLPEKTVTTVTTYELVATPTNATGKIAEGGTTVNYYYRAVPKVTEVAKQAPVTANYYLEGTTDKLAPIDEQGQKDIGSAYTTETKTIAPKVVTQDLEDRVITTTTTYELVSEPTDKNGNVPVGGKVVNYFYRAVVKEDVVMKQAPVLANYYKEGTTEKLAPSDDQGQKDIGSKYTTEAKVIPNKVDVQDLEDRTVTTTTSYELVAQPTDKEGTVPVGGKVVNYFYREVVNTETVMKKAPVLVNYFLEGTETKLADSDDQGEKVIATDYTSSAKTIEPKVVVNDLEDRVVTTTTTYELVSEPTNKEGKVQVGGTTVNYYYRTVVKEEVVMKKAPVVVNYYLDGTTTKLAESDDQGQKEIGSEYTSEVKDIPSRTETEDFPDKTVTKTISYVLKEVPEDAQGEVPVGGKVVNYYYVEDVTIDETYKQAPLVANYYLEGTADKLADSEDYGEQNIGSSYTTESKEIEPKVETVETDEKTTVTTTRYELVEEPSDKEGTIPAGGQVVNYYYRAVVSTEDFYKSAPVVANYYIQGTTEKLADSDDQGEKEIKSSYTTSAKEIPSKTEVQDLEDRIITKVTTYQLVETPSDAKGIVPVGGKVINYYYRPVVRESMVMKETKLKVNYLLEGTRTALHAPKIIEGLHVNSLYNETPLTFDTVVTKKVERNKEVVTTTKYELVGMPSNSKGRVPATGAEVDFFYRQVVTNEEYPKIPNEAPKVEVPEYNETIAIPGTPEVHTKPEFTRGVVPNDAPKVDIPEYDKPIGIPGTPEVHEKPEFHFELPKDAPKVEIPEFKGGVVPNEAPVLELPELKVPEEPAKPQPTPVVEKVEEAPAPVVQENQLPNTGGGDSAKASAFGIVSLLAGLGLAARKRKED